MARANILFVENDPGFLKTATELLEGEDYKVIPATTPAEARKILKAGKIDLAILDVRLQREEDAKDASGLDLAVDIPTSIPKIILTSYGEYKSMGEALKSRLGFDIDFVHKEEKDWFEIVSRRIKEALARPRVTETEALQETRGFVARLQKYRPWVQLGCAIVAIVILLLALGAGIGAIILGDPRWLLAVVFLAILMVVFIGIAVFMPE